MTPYALFTDGTCDIPREYRQIYEINYLPMKITINPQTLEFSDGWTQDEYSEFYRRLRSGQIASTTQITPFEYEEAFEKRLVKGEDILYIGFSSGMSDTMQSARLAARNLMEKYPERRVVALDSKSVTGGLGMLVFKACKNRESGMSIEDNAREIERLSKSCTIWFTVDDLYYLGRSGRLNTISAIMGSALHIKPLVEVSDGRLVIREKVQGRKSSIKALVKKAAQLSGGKTLKHVLVTHTDAEDAATQLVSQLKSAIDAEEILYMEMSPIIGAHVGPGLVSVIFID
ncbi:MAG: DegV family protein [Clostridia bacterium]|nr:DegV family protein [Clostridia bacterium]